MHPEPWYPSISPAEYRDSRRSCIYEEAAAEVRTWAQRGAVQVDLQHFRHLPGGWPLVTRGEDESFVLHGSFAFAGNTGATVTRIDTRTRRVVWSQQLINTQQTGEWNYPGGIGVHRDGYVYAVYGYRLSKLHPHTGAVLATILLPTAQAPQDVTYNGFVLLPDGNIVTKSLYRMPGCTANGFRALSRGGLVSLPSDMTVVDPETMRIVASAPAPEHLLGRITTGVHRGVCYIYAAGIDAIYRYVYENGTLSYDAGWGPVVYRQPGETPGSAIAVVEDWIFIQGNAGPAQVPLTVTAISQDDPTRRHQVMPFPSHRASFNAAKLTVDAANQRVYTTDSLAGWLAAFDFDPARGFCLRWKAPQGSNSPIVLVGKAHERVLIASQIVDTWATWLPRKHLSRYIPWLAYRSGGEHIVWRHPDSGATLARSPRLPIGLAIVPGFEGTLYYPTLFEGLIVLTTHPV